MSQFHVCHWSESESESLRLSLSHKAKDCGKESEMYELAASENRLSDLSVSFQTFASLLHKCSNENFFHPIIYINIVKVDPW